MRASLERIAAASKAPVACMTTGPSICNSASGPPPQIGITMGMPSATATAGEAMQPACPITIGPASQASRRAMIHSCDAQQDFAFAPGAAS